MKKSIITILTFCILSFLACAQSTKSTGDKTMGTTINVTVNGVTKTATLVVYKYGNHRMQMACS